METWDIIVAYNICDEIEEGFPRSSISEARLITSNLFWKITLNRPAPTDCILHAFKADTFWGLIWLCDFLMEDSEEIGDLRRTG
jgi:hypothetical protein